MRYYDEGWNAFVRGEPFNPNASLDWKDGWLDCLLIPVTERKFKMTKHKHYDCIVAWAEGKEIEFSANKTHWSKVSSSPCWEPSFEYRIKPTPKSPGQLLYELWGGRADVGVANTGWEHLAEEFLRAYNKQQQELMK